SLAADVERTLTAVGAETAAAILGSAREAQGSFASTSADAASQIRAISTDIERGLAAVTSKSTDAIQNAASTGFGSTMTGKTDEIVTYVQQQTDRLSQIIDGRRGALVEALTAKTTQLTTDIDRVTSDSLKAIETRGQAFSQAMGNTGNDVARSITSAGDLATGAVSKSLKDLEV